MASVTVKLYRFEQGGRAKDWAVPAAVRSTDIELVVFFGVTGKALRQAVTPAARCVNGNPAAEARRREREKLGKGYRYLGEYQLDLANRRELMPDTADEPEVASPCVYWERRATTGSGEPLTEKALLALSRPSDRCLQRLLTAGLIQRQEVRLEGAADGRWAFQIHNRDRRRWRFGFDWQPVIDTRSPDAHGLDDRGTGRGVIPLTPEHVAEVAFFLLLCKSDTALAVANEAGRLVTCWPEALAIEPATLVLLDLAPTRAGVLLEAIDADDGGWFY